MVKKRIRVNQKVYGLLESGLLYAEAKELAITWRRLSSFDGAKRLATRREYASGWAVYVRPTFYVY